MAYFTGSIRSKVLGMDTQLNLILPDRDQLEEVPLRVLYLLHGIAGNSTSWTRFTSIERYAQDRNFVVIMPEVQRSFYQDLKYGLNYFTYVSEELPRICRRLFHIEPIRSRTYVAGLSMGGYGAMRVGLSRPDLFAGIGSFSGAVDIRQIARETLEGGNESLIREFTAMAGEGLEVTEESDIYYLLDQAAKLGPAKRPKFYISCGFQDFLYSMNTAMKQYMEALPLELRYMDWEGAHSWDFWDRSIVHCMDYFMEDEV